MVTETTCDLSVCVLVTRDGKSFLFFLQRWLKVGCDFNAAAHVIKDLKLSCFILLKHRELFRCFTSSHYFQVLDVCTRFLCRSASLQLSSVFRVCCFWEHLKQALLTVISPRTDLLKDSSSCFSSGARSRLRAIFKEMWYLWSTVRGDGRWSQFKTFLFSDEI